MPSSVFTEAYQSFVAVMVEARKSAGLTQVELSSRLGKPQSYVSKYERGERRIDVVEFCTIAEALGNDPKALLAQHLEGRQ